MATIPARDIKFTHANDVAWIIKLYLDIYGGDPAPLIRPDAISKVALEGIRALSKHLDPAKQRAVTAALG